MPAERYNRDNRFYDVCVIYNAQITKGSDRLPVHFAEFLFVILSLFHPCVSQALTYEARATPFRAASAITSYPNFVR